MKILVKGVALTATVVVAAALAGCSGAGNGEGEGDLDFTYWSMSTETEPQAEVIKNIIERYEDETGAKITVEWQGREVLNQVSTNLLGGDIPDLVDQDSNSLGNILISAGETASLDDLYETTIPGEDVKVGEALNQGLLDVIPDYAGDGEPHFLPFTVAGGLFLFNANDPLVTTAPKTWDEVLDICAQAKTDGRACFGVDGDVGYYVDLYLENLLARNGGPGAIKDLIEDKSGAGWDTDAVKKTFEQVEELVQAGYFGQGYNASKWPQQQNDWAAGKSVFMVNASYVINETKEFQGADFKVGATAFPITDNPDFDSTDVTAFGFSILEKGKHKAGAEAFLAYLLKKDNLEEVSTSALAVTSRPDVEVPEEIAPLSEVYNQENLRQTFETTVPGDYYAKVLDASFAKLLLGSLTAEAALAEGRALHVAFWENQ